MLKQFHYIDPNGKDQGVNVRNRSAELVKLLGDVEQIRAERKKSRSNRNKYGGVEGGAGAGLGGFSSGAGRYGGFGSEQASGYGGYQGEVYGDGGGFGGRETDFSGTQRRGDQFEEYDEEEEGSSRPSASRTSATAAAPAKKAAPKPKEPVPDLFDFTEDEPVSKSNGKAPATSALDDFGPVQGGAANDDDDFDDFQSAASPSVAQPKVNPLAAALSPPPTISSTTSATQFAAPKPVAPAQTANINNILSQPAVPSSTASPVPSLSSPPPQPANTPIRPTQTQYKPSGPNYYTSVNASINSNPSAPSVFSSRPQTSTPSQGSFSSSTTAANLGKPTPKAAATGGGDAFANLWSTAGSGVGVEKKAANKGPDLASMAKAKSEAGLWGAPAAPTQQRPGAIAPSPNTAAGAGRPNQSLGNGLDDLLG
jgi:epsin